MMAKFTTLSIIATTIKSASLNRHRVNAMAKNKKKCAIPKHELESFAEVIYPSLKEYLESPEGKAAFERWKKEVGKNRKR